jgi:hypothetical protein
MTVSLPPGPLVLDLEGPRLSAEERHILRHPLVGGVILFERNFESLAVLRELTSEIHSLRQPPLLISIDHEGGRVQRFRHGFTALPPMRALGAIWDGEPARALQTAEAAGHLRAARSASGRLLVLLAAPCAAGRAWLRRFAAREVLRDWRPRLDPASARRLETLLPASPAQAMEDLRIQPDYLAALEAVEAAQA